MVELLAQNAERGQLTLDSSREVGFMFLECLMVCLNVQLWIPWWKQRTCFSYLCSNCVKCGVSWCGGVLHS